MDMTSPRHSPLFTLAVDAYVWGFPRLLYASCFEEFRKSGAPLNRFVVMDRPATPGQSGASADLLQGLAWLEVGTDPVVLDLPDAGERWYSIQLTDAHANRLGCVGTRTSGNRRQQVLIASAGWPGRAPPGMRLFRADSRHVLCTLSTQVEDPRDAQAASRFHQELGAAPMSRYPNARLGALLVRDLTPYAPRAHNPLEKWAAAFFDRLGDALAEDPPQRAEDLQALARFEALRIGPGRHPTRDLGALALLAEAVQAGHRRIAAAHAATARKGWAADWGSEHDSEHPLHKATFNRFGLGAAGAHELLQLMPVPLSLRDGQPVPPWSSLGPDGQMLSGACSYRLRFLPGQLPKVDAFWSLTLYGTDFSFYPNALERYAIGDRTPGLAYGSEGSLDLLIQHRPPESGVDNWLPAPTGGFMLIFRAFQPRLEFLNGEYLLPSLEIVRGS